MAEHFGNTCRNEDTTDDPTHNVKTDNNNEQVLCYR